MIRLLAIASEAYPLLKTGGLADVVGALPDALRPNGVVTRTLLPGYPAALAALTDREEVLRYADLFGGPATVLAGTASGLDVFLIDAPHLFARAGNPYLGPGGADWPDNGQRFAALARVGAEIGQGAVAAFQPDILHAHDWQAALAAAYLRYSGRPAPPSVVTIHNLAFQGTFPVALFPELGLPAGAFSIDGVEYYGGVGFLKGGLANADAITTVSPTYAEEIKTPEGGMGLDGLLRTRANILYGIVNGIDAKVWNPASDVHLREAYRSTSLPRRAHNKRALEQRFGLAASDGPIFSIISRLTWQKGIDLVIASADAIVALGGRLAILGSGEPALEAAVGDLALRYPGQIGSINGYDEPLAHLMQGGADAILVPSRFEPCGLTQQCALRYGTIPIVSRVGGLADTVVDANDAALSAGVATGIVFSPVSATGLTQAVRRAAALFAGDGLWQPVQRQAMKADVSWKRSAGRYATLFAGLDTARKAGVAM